MHKTAEDNAKRFFANYIYNKKESDIWSDYVSIFIKDSIHISDYPSRILNNFNNYTNGSIYPHNNFINLKKW